ncbi:MAG: hypothetical protein P8Z80_03345 [Pseudolabrys sp.]|jgi:hypothetical protein
MKTRSLAFLLLAEVAAISLWFVSAAVLAGLALGPAFGIVAMLRLRAMHDAPV